MAVKEGMVVSGGRGGIDMGGSKLGIAQCYLDLSVTANNVSDGDVIKAIKVPAGTKVMDVTLRVETVEGGTATVDVGFHTDDAGATALDADGFYDGASIETTGFPNKAGDETYGSYKQAIAATDSVICVTAKAALDAAKIRITAVLADCNTF